MSYFVPRRGAHAVLVLGAAGACSWLACAPDTNLLGEGSAPGSGDGPSAGAAVLLNPAAGSMDVPVNLATLLVRFPDADTAASGGLDLTADGQRTASGPPAPEDCPPGEPGTCLRFPLTDLLMPSTTYLVAPGGGASGGSPSPGAGPIGQFATSVAPDLTAPAITALAVEPSGPCVLVSFETDEPAAATLLVRGGALMRDVPAGVGATRFSVAASLAAFGAGAEVALVARAVDLAGNVAESAAVTATVPAGLLPLAITEIHANPAGPEPTQEFVEIRNLGAAPLDVAGLAIEDAKGADVLPSSAIGAGRYALVVPSTFDAASPTDVAPAPGTILIRVDTRIGSDGLANSGEPVRLRQADGTVVSSYTAAVDVSASKWSGASVHRRPEDACDQPPSWTRMPAAATPGWAAP